MNKRISGFICGILSCLFWPVLPGHYLALITAVIAILLIKKQPFVSACLLGCYYCFWCISYQLSDLKHLMQPDSSITGRVISLPQQRKFSNRFFFKLSDIKIKGEHKKSSAKLLIYWPGQHQLSQGQQLQLQVNIRPIHGMANQGGFNYQKWLISQGVMATAKVIKGSVISHNPSWRAHVASKLIDAVDKLTYGSLIRALAIADKQGISTAQWHVINQTGTSHLFAISGLHLSIVSGLTYWLIIKLFGLFSWWRGQRLRYLALGSAMLIALCYSQLAGFSLPTIRALVMLVVAALFIVLKQRLTSGELLLYCLLAVLLVDPLAVFAMGFWLSFVAVAAIFLLIKMSRPVSARQYPH